MLIDRALVLACLATSPLTLEASARYTPRMPITEREYHERKRKLQEERAELSRRLETLDKRLESLEVIWTWFKEDQGQTLTPETKRPAPPSESTLLEGTTPTPNGAGEKFSLLNEVDKAALEIGGEIKQPIVTKLLQEKFPNENIQGASVSNRLSRLRELGKLEVVRKGVGSQPTVYRRVA